MLWNKSSSMMIRSSQRRLLHCRGSLGTVAGDRAGFMTMNPSSSPSKPFLVSSPPPQNQRQQHFQSYNNNSNNTMIRTMSSMMGGNNNNNLRAFPSYTVFGDNCLLTLKLSAPTFKIIPKSNTLVVDGSKRGRMLFEWTPKTPEGRINREGSIRFALSPEEVGLLLDQLPENEVDLSRRMFSATGDGGHMANMNEPEKVFRITAGSTPRSLRFSIDFEKDGVGGQAQASFPAVSSSDDEGMSFGGEPNVLRGPLVVEVQCGEFQVLKSLFQTTLPYLTGWTTQLEVFMRNSGTSPGGPYAGGGGSGGSY